MNSNLDHLFSILARSTSQNYIGEKISQLEHALQAADLAQHYSSSPSAAIACLFHDVGHLIESPVKLMDSWGVDQHEYLGAQLVRKAGLSEEIGELISSHVLAKRYLVSTNPVYKKNLSLASLHTLEFQGGTLTQKEIREFEMDPLFEKKLLVRRCDDEAKVVGQKTNSLEHYKKYVLDFLKIHERELL